MRWRWIWKVDMRFLAVLTVKNEGAFLLEWLAHHQACGFSDFIICSNDCSDGTDLMLDHLAAQGLVHHIRNDGPYLKAGVQFSAYKRAAALPVFAQADWVMTLDIDEFVNIHVGNRTLPALLDALPDADAITLTWRLFGNAGVVRYTDRPITHSFTHAAPRVIYWPWRAAMFKTLYRNNGAYAKLGVHRPRSPNPDMLPNLVWRDGCGRRLEPRFKTTQIFSPFGRDNTQLAQLNHYPLGAMESYVLKADRGRAVHRGDMLGMDYWVERNFSSHEDRSILALGGGAARDALLADPVLARLHQGAVAWRHARFQALMRQEPYRALFGRLLMCPPTRPVTQKGAAFLLGHARAGQTGASAATDKATDTATGDTRDSGGTQTHA